ARRRAISGSASAAPRAAAIASIESVPKPPETPSVSQSPTATGVRSPVSAPATETSAGTTSVAPRPSATQATASATIAVRITGGASCARAAASLRGSARNGIPNAFTKPAMARPPVSARADQDDPDVLDRREREKPLEVVVDEGVEHADHGRHGAGEEHGHAPPRGADAEPVETRAEEPVDTELDHHAGHEGRDVARRRR